jgi:hypothetical protein
MTADPHWPEVLEALSPGETAQDRPDIMSRIFDIKSQHFLKNVTGENGTFGESEYYVYRIEFQKRAFPHMHLALRVKQKHIPQTSAIVDELLSAELPDPELDAELFALVSTKMIHGPCGPNFPNAVCMVNGACKRHFPKPFCEETLIDADGQMQYRRRKRPPVLVKGRLIDNQWVVPYNRSLMLTYRCHLNFEICHSILAFKYLFKYCFKGDDQALIKPVAVNSAPTTKPMEVFDPNATAEPKIPEKDETKTYLSCRYIGPCEAWWRNTKLPLQGLSHACIKLIVHLPGFQEVYFKEGVSNHI